MEPNQNPMQNPMQSMGQMPMGEEPVTEEEKQALLDMIAKIKESMGGLNATSFAVNNKTEELRKDMLRQVFERLQMAGVDLSDRNSVGEFILRLKEQAPELAEMFEKSMDVLLGTENSLTGAATSEEELNQMPPTDPELGMIG